MDSGRAAFFILASTMTLLCAVATISAKPTMDQQWNEGPQDLSPHYELHPIDNCIFVCDRCFKGEALVKCANKCILSEAQMDSEWTTTCPFFTRQYGLASNPFRH